MNTIAIFYESPVQVDSLMWQVIKQMIKSKKQILDEFYLTCSQFDILTALNHFTTTNQEIIQIDLSEKTGIDPMTTSTILRNMQKKGLITRDRSIINTRTVIVQMTTKGKSIYKEARSKIEAINTSIYQNISQKDLTSQLLVLSDKLNKLNF